jgi:hypothetical protein
VEATLQTKPTGLESGCAFGAKDGANVMAPLAPETDATPLFGQLNSRVLQPIFQPKGL